MLPLSLFLEVSPGLGKVSLTDHCCQQIAVPRSFSRTTLVHDLDPFLAEGVPIMGIMGNMKLRKLEQWQKSVEPIQCFLTVLNAH